jgi:hypothetical protein
MKVKQPLHVLIKTAGVCVFCLAGLRLEAQEIVIDKETRALFPETYDRAEGGGGAAQVFVGDHYLKNSDEKTAVKWYRKALKADSPQAAIKARLKLGRLLSSVRPPAGGPKPGDGKDGGNEPGGDKDGGNKPGGDKDGGNKPGGDKDGGNKPGGDKDGGNKPGGDKDGGNKPGGDKDGSNKPGGDKDGGNKPGDGKNGKPQSQNSLTDPVEAYKWAFVAQEKAKAGKNSRIYYNAKKLLKQLTKTMDERQIEEAKQKARDFLNK